MLSTQRPRTTQPLWELQTKVMPRFIRGTRRLPETEPIRPTGTAMVWVCAHDLWEAVAVWQLEHPQQLPSTISRAAVAVYLARNESNPRIVALRLAMLVDALDEGPPWIACSKRVDEALGVATRFLRFAVPE